MLIVKTLLDEKSKTLMYGQINPLYQDHWEEITSLVSAVLNGAEDAGCGDNIAFINFE